MVVLVSVGSFKGHAKEILMEAYKELEDRFRRLALIDEARAMLGWDWATMMPTGGAESRAEQLAELSLIAHELVAEPQLEDLLNEAEVYIDKLDDWCTSNLREMRRLWLHNSALPATLVEALSKATSACELSWREAKSEDNFVGVLPKFAMVVKLVREKAQAKANALSVNPYDALLDQYEPGARAAHIDPVFDDLIDFLPSFTDRVIEHQQTFEPARTFKGPFPVAKQREFSKLLMGVVGFPFDHGRLDESHHPFSGGTPEDLRITTRYEEANFASALMAVLHETGHALYDYGLPKTWRRQPVGEAPGMSIHESQSLLIEMQVCRSPEFIRSITPMIRDAFGTEDPALTADNLLRHWHCVERSLVRVEADEVTYPSHVILRYRLERLLISGELPPDELPEAWREGMREFVGVEPSDDREGCLQDIHWFGGDFGYFPTYTLGALSAAQLFEAAKRDDQNILPSIASCDFGPLYAWLRPNVHSLGGLFPAPALINQATGNNLSTAAFKAHLNARYLGL